MRGKAHDDATKGKVLAALLTGETVTAAAKMGGVSRATVRDWWRAFEKTPEYAAIYATVAEQFAIKKGNIGSGAHTFDLSVFADPRYGLQPTKREST